MSSAPLAAVRDAPPPACAGDAAESLLALADDELVVGHRHSEWLGLCPFLEEDLAMASIAQDELGHARALYALVWPQWSERDAMVVRRPVHRWRSSALVEQVEGTWEGALVRHLLYDLAEPLRWEQVTTRFASSVPGLADVAVRAEAEERYHRRHAVDLVTRLARGTLDAKERLQRALDRLWPDALAVVDDDVRPALVETCADVFATAGLVVPTSAPSSSDRRVRTGDFASVQESLVAVATIDPSATW